jgi:hypothetical protein
MLQQAALAVFSVWRVFASLENAASIASFGQRITKLPMSLDTFIG